MRLSSLIRLSCALLLVANLHAQQGTAEPTLASPPAADVTSEPAQVVLIFTSDPSDFQALELDAAPFGSLSIPADFASVWPVAPGNRKLTLKASGAEDSSSTIQFVPGQTLFLFLGVEKSSGPASKRIVVKTLSPKVPKAKTGSKKTFVLVAPGASPVKGSLMQSSNKFSDVVLTPGKLELLGEGGVVFRVGGETVIAGESQSYGVQVYVLLPTANNRVRAVVFSSIIPEDEKQPQAATDRP